MSGSASSSRRGSRRNTLVTATHQPSQAEPQQATNNTQHSLTQAVQYLNLTGNTRQLHPRSPPGRSGTKLNVLTNHFALTSFGGQNIYQWNVNISKSTKAGPDAKGRVKRRVLELLLQQPLFLKAFTDYEKTLVSFASLDASKAYTVDYMEPEETQPRTGDRRVLFTVTLNSAAPPLPTQPMKDIIRKPGLLLPRAKEYEDVLNIILLRFAGQHAQLTTAARGTKVFSLTTTPPRQKLGFGLEAYRGYIRRLRNLQGGLFLCFNVSYGVMYQEDWVDLVIESWKPPQPPNNNNHKMAMLQQFLQKVKVKGMFGSHRVKPMSSIAHTNGMFADAETVTFYCESHPATGEKLERQISVSGWFKAAYPGLAFRNHPRIVLNVGSGSRKIWWPANLCRIEPGQPLKSFVPHPEQTKAMITFACRKPGENISLIKGEGLKMLGIRPSTTQPQMSDAGALPFQLSLEMTIAPARRIKSPALIFLTNSVDAERAATGQWNLQNRKFEKAGAPVKYAVLVLRKQDDRAIENLDHVGSTLSAEIARYLNLSTRPQPTKVQGSYPSRVYPLNNEVVQLTKIFNDLKNLGIGYCFVITSSRGWYPAIKTACDSTGIHTTVTLRQRGNQARVTLGEIGNLLLKFNMKLGGVNWCLNMANFRALRGKQAMFLGADVIHPPPGAKKKAPSVAALVASTDPTPAQFPGTIALQHHPEESKQSVEMILTLDTMMESRLELWAKKNGGGLPELLFFYRDGVSEGQLQQVLDQEVPLLEAAIRKIHGKYRKPHPKLFVQATQKRHIARLYQPANDNSRAFDNKGNPLPGLWVDQMIVSNSIDDSYAVHHKCLQGTTVPVHHVIIMDEIGLGVDEYQELTHGLAFLFERSVTSTRIPAPAKYADLLCERAKHRLVDVFFPGPGGSEQVYKLSEATFLGQQSVHSSLQDTMYYI